MCRASRIVLVNKLAIANKINYRGLRRDSSVQCLIIDNKMIHVENNLKNTDNEELFNQRTHFIPCKIDSDGRANVQKFFETNIVETENKGLKASFRGYPLDGVKMSMPDGYQAVVATEAKRPLAEDADRKFQVAGGFKEFIYWNWDKLPSKNDNLVKALDWTDIAEAIHGD